MKRITKLRSQLKIRIGLPEDLEREFITYKDIKSIDRIRVSAWLGVALTSCMFGLDIFRLQTGVYWTEEWYPVLTWFHAFGLLFFLPAIHTTRNKQWIIQTRLRRGIVIWGMVFITIVFLLGQSVFIYLQRESLVTFFGYIFIANWMFSMSHRERMLFSTFSFSVMAVTIFIFKTDYSIMVGGEIVIAGYPSDLKIANMIEAFFLSLVAFIFDAFDYNLKVTNFLSQRRIEMEQEHIKRLEAFKSRFFTNLTHELRTPLTMISGMAREIAEDPVRWAAEGTEAIKRNAGNLLNLVNQILELSKIESDAMPLHIVRGDVVTYVGYMIDAFRGHAQAKRIKLHFLAQEEEMVIDYDPEKYLTILSNLLSNAIKFSPEDGHVYISTAPRNHDGQSFLEITVRDTGMGIPEDELEHIFERFYQAQNELTQSGIGTGIGLSLVYELVKLMKGEIEVKSAPGKGTTFRITLPTSLGHAGIAGRPLLRGEIRDNIHFYMPPIHVPEAVETNREEEDRQEILIIEDNPDVIKYLQICLGDIYRLECCMDGQAGIDKAIEIVPDLVLSDVMMPVKTGLEVCHELKQHPVTSHVPVILLSAKADLESRTAGLANGADVYLVKPFDKQELRLQIHNLLERRQELHARYGVPEPVAPDDEKAALQKEDQFITKVRETVLSRLDETEFSVTDLCRAVFLSRTQLHKKLKALSGLSATLFIRNIRLAEARRFLSIHSDQTIADIAYSVGFSDPNYFTRCYVQEYGESPSETRNKVIPK